MSFLTKLIEYYNNVYLNSNSYKGNSFLGMKTIDGVLYNGSSYDDNSSLTEEFFIFKYNNRNLSEKESYEYILYLFSLPIHINILDYLNNNINYKFICVHTILSETDVSSDSSNIYLYILSYKKILFSYEYNSKIVEINKKPIILFELLICVQSVHYNALLSAIKKDIKNIKFLKHNLFVEEIKSFKHFFRRDFIYHKYKNNNNILSYMSHRFYIYKWNEDLIDYYYLCGYLKNTSELSLNERIYEMCESINFIYNYKYDLLLYTNYLLHKTNKNNFEHLIFFKKYLIIIPYFYKMSIIRKKLNLLNN